MAPTLWRMQTVWTCIAATLCVVEVQAGVSYQNPAVGWRYKLEGNSAGFGDGNTQALDGTWRHDQGDKWDGSAPGDTGAVNPACPASCPPQHNSFPAPGGVGQYNESGTSYLRLQDTGNPEPFGWIQGQSHSEDPNRRINLAHQIDGDGALSGTQYLVLDNGFTISFRARIPNSGPLDPIYTQINNVNTILPWFPPPPADYNSNSTVDSADYVTWRKNFPSTTFQLANEVENTTPGQVSQEDYAAWRARFGNVSNLGRGYPLHDEGRGMFYIVQNDPTNFNLDGGLGFSLMTSVDAQNYCAIGANANLCAQPKGGLIMNNLLGTTANAQIDTFDAGTLNLLEIPDASLSNWHEFWITITQDGVIGTHTVNVYLDGSTSPTTFHVTATNDGKLSYTNNAWLAMGLSSDGLFGSVDVDFYAYSLGVITPIAAASASASSVPEPSTAILLLLALLMFGQRCGRSFVY